MMKVFKRKEEWDYFETWPDRIIIQLNGQMKDDCVVIFITRIEKKSINTLLSFFPEKDESNVAGHVLCVCVVAEFQWK
jgi:hypothetical protein